MKQILISFFLVMSFKLLAEDNCKNLKACSDWATSKTSIKYDLGKFERRSLKLEKDFSISEGNADFVFNYILQSNDLVRIKRESGVYQIIAMRDIKGFQFPAVRPEEIPASLDFFSVEFTLSNKEQVKNGLIMIKKLLSKNGKVLEVADAPKIQVVDSGIQLNAIKLVMAELGK